MWRAHATACLVLLLGVTQVLQKPYGQHFAPGEVIVKFSARSKGSELFSRALAEGSPPDAALSSYIKSVSSDVGVPLEVKRVGSGGNVVLGIRQEELVSDLANQLRDIAGIEDVHVVPRESASVPTVEVNFKENSHESEVLAQAAEKGIESSAKVHMITRKLEQRCRVALAGRVASSRQLLVTLDMQRLTLDLANRLAKRADVEYAQPNFIRHVTTGNGNVLSPK